ncbi:MAG: CFI-box-CTERM domain-containing protein [Bacillota bacterium]|nr:CFI-box-CTERM domain-containing protein [Bacillota bacterium]
MGDFNYDKAEADLYDVGCPYSEDVYGYRSEKGFDEFMRENGLNPDNYKNSSDSNDNSSNNSGCFITTACVTACNLPDNCFELETLRAFRDSYLKNQEEGAADIKHYYNIAPKIVENINKTNESDAIYKDLYTHLVAPCVLMIKNGKYKDAYKLYKRMVLSLEENYGK